VHDRVRSVAGARELAAALPDAELLLVAAGHTPLHERPSVVAAAARSQGCRAVTADGARPPGRAGGAGQDTVNSASIPCW
jgi:pimeloyl-ACP methyl ester carboxylesterase